MRPTEAPPDPPPTRNSRSPPVKQFQNTESQEDSSSSRGSSLEIELEENYCSNLFHSEPLYQFYDIDKVWYSTDIT